MSVNPDKQSKRNKKDNKPEKTRSSNAYFPALTGQSEADKLSSQKIINKVVTLEKIPADITDSPEPSLKRSQLLEALHQSRQHISNTEKDPVSLEDLPTTIPSAPKQLSSKPTRLKEIPLPTKKQKPSLHSSRLLDALQSTANTENSEKDPVSLEDLPTTIPSTPKQLSSKPTRLMNALNSIGSNSPGTPTSDPNSTSSNSSVGTGISSDPNSAESSQKSKKQREIEEALKNAKEMELLAERYNLAKIEDDSRTAIEKEQEEAFKKLQQLEELNSKETQNRNQLIKDREQMTKDMELHLRQLKLLHEEEQNREQLKKQERELYPKLLTHRLVQLEAIKRSQLEEEWKNSLNAKLKTFEDKTQQLQSTQTTKEEELRQKAIKATTTQEKQQIEKQWSQTIDTDIFQLIRANILNNINNHNLIKQREKFQQDLQKINDFIKFYAYETHTALQVAIRENRNDIVTIILTNITNPHLRANYINQHCLCGISATALHFATEFSINCADMVKLLIANGANANSLNVVKFPPAILCLERIIELYSGLRSTEEQNRNKIIFNIINMLTAVELLLKDSDSNNISLILSYLRTFFTRIKQDYNRQTSQVFLRKYELILNKLKHIISNYTPQQPIPIQKPKKQWK